MLFGDKLQSIDDKAHNEERKNNCFWNEYASIKYERFFDVPTKSTGAVFPFNS